MINGVLTRTLWRSTFPGVESVTLKSRSGADTAVSYTSYTIHHAKQRPSDAGEEGHGATYHTGLRHKNWQIWQDALDAASAPAVKPGDVIVDSSGISWLVNRVSNRMFGNLFDCSCSEKP